MRPLSPLASVQGLVNPISIFPWGWVGLLWGNTQRFVQQSQLSFRPYFGCVGMLAVTWNVKEVPVKSYRNEAFCTGFACCDPYTLAIQPWQMHIVFVPSFSLCDCDIHCIRHWVPIIHTLKSTQFFLSVNKLYRFWLLWDFFCFLVYKFIFRISTFSLFKILTS